MLFRRRSLVVMGTLMTRMAKSYKLKQKFFPYVLICKVVNFVRRCIAAAFAHSICTRKNLGSFTSPFGRFQILIVIFKKDASCKSFFE